MPEHPQANFLEKIDAAEATQDFSHLISCIHQLFASPEVLMTAFQTSETATRTRHNVDLVELRRIYKAINDSSSPSLRSALVYALRAFTASVQPFLPASGDPTPLRVLLIALTSEFALVDPDTHTTVLEPLCRVTVSLTKEMDDVFVNWLESFDEMWLASIVNVLQQFITVRLYTTGNVRDIIAVVQMLSLVNRANRRSRVLPHTSFYNDAVNEIINPPEDYRIYLHSKHQGRKMFSFASFPFLLNASLKANLLKLDSRVSMASQQPMAGFLPMMQRSHLGLAVRRDFVVQDAMQQLNAADPAVLKRQLRVKFVGEEGIDEGGLTKEFFQIVTRELFDPSYGMFTYFDKERFFWFNGNSLEANIEFELIGTMLGLAIYNGVILDVHFPLALYKKLQGIPLCLDDLAALQPAVVSSMHQLLTYDGDVEGDLDLTFTVVVQVWDSSQEIELVPGGAAIPVTKENRAEYVEKYVEYFLSRAVERQFEAFRRGFVRVADSELVQALAPEELELLICGSQVLDFNALQENAKYDGYTPHDREIQDFWTIVHEFSLEEKKKLLQFVTGSDRAPVGGLGSLKFVVAKNGGSSEHLPTSHTCFNALMLPAYSTKDIMRARLVKAIEEAEGFGLL